MKYTALFTALLVVLATLQTQAQTFGDIGNHDGIYDTTNGDTYGMVNDANNGFKEVAWYNGHENSNSIYGTEANPRFTTTVRYGNDDTYFWLFIEVPLYSKNMIWDGNVDWKKDYPISNLDPTKGLTEDDVASYRTHHETHHDPGDMKLDFKGATGSEKIIFGPYEADLANFNSKNLPGLATGGYKDSVDYLVDNGLVFNADGTVYDPNEPSHILDKTYSLNRDVTMSFELVFAIDEKDSILTALGNPIDLHTSPERGLVPEPSSTLLLGLASMGMLLRRKRQ